ncbi:hypothetical protein [Pukyongiella litopenaei]|uniref:hypothetical protein n=1 Tax=Pukyongiella litopenaei TaxID=2605946 RepID=UPI001B8095E4|nr:hypothetical protein [Pukyongiella litopenaei]
MNKLPIREAKGIAERHGWDQVIVVARKVGENGFEHVVTYGVDAAHCEAAARAGMAIKHHVMRWPASLFDSELRVLSVGRDADNPRSISVVLSEEVSDDDLRMIHEFLKPPTFSPERVAEGV